ncbi:hypothetical protein Tco_1015211 [Tanacetum coccineum]|uniref:Uncharacterized protein n=1 Tax=Tanacetum coccineum TaxID=301880 RepID=A0ABQ5FK95_9ASTR
MVIVMDLKKRFDRKTEFEDESKFDGGVIRAPPLSTSPLPSTTVEHNRCCIHTSFTNLKKGNRLGSGSYCTVHEGFTEFMKMVTIEDLEVDEIHIYMKIICDF